MRESTFINRNKTRWEEFERVVKNQAEAPPDKLAELFIQITDDPWESGTWIGINSYSKGARELDILRCGANEGGFGKCKPSFL